MSRYTLISTVTGALDYLLALLLLHMGIRPWISLAASIIVAGVADYAALERWGYPGRKGAFSSRRLAGSALVELGTYVIRMLVLSLWKTHLNDIEPTEHMIGLAAAYLVAFLFGYVARSRFVFVD